MKEGTQTVRHHRVLGSGIVPNEEQLLREVRKTGIGAWI